MKLLFAGFSSLLIRVAAAAGSRAAAAAVVLVVVIAARRRGRCGRRSCRIVVLVWASRATGGREGIVWLQRDGILNFHDSRDAAGDFFRTAFLFIAVHKTAELNDAIERLDVNILKFVERVVLEV